MDWTQILIALIGVLFGGGIGAFAKLKIGKARDKLDLIKDLNAEMADKTRKIRELNAEIFSLQDKCHDFEVRHLYTRCDLKHCGFRRPPLPWMRGEGDEWDETRDEDFEKLENSENLDKGLAPTPHSLEEAHAVITADVNVSSIPTEE